MGLTRRWYIVKRVEKSYREKDTSAEDGKLSRGLRQEIEGRGMGTEVEQIVCERGLGTHENAHLLRIAGPCGSSSHGEGVGCLKKD